MKSLIGLVVVVFAGAASLLPAAVSPSTQAAEAADGGTVSFLVLNRHTGESVIQHEVHRQFRSASLVNSVRSRTAIDLTRPAMHTSGTLGADDAEILVLLSLHPVGTSYNESAALVTTLTRTIYLASRAPGL